MTEKELAALFEEIELRLIASLKRNLPAHQKWESDLGFDWPAWQAEKIKSMERFRKANEAIMREYRDTIQKETRILLEEQFHESAGDADLTAESGVAAGVADASFFDLWDEKIESLIEEVQGKERAVERAALRTLDDVYRQTLVRADTALQTGSVTLQQAIEIAVEDFAKRGLNCVEYRDGRRVNIADYAYMALKTSNTRAALLGGAKQRMALGIDTVRVSAYGGCSDTCLPWQGRVYIDDVFAVFTGEIIGDRGKSRSGKWYPLLSVAVKAGLFHPNCRHTLTSYQEGAREPMQFDGEKVRENYRLEQKQRALERKIRKWKRMEAAAADPVVQKGYGKKVREAQAELRAFINAHKDVLRRDPWREKTYGTPNVGREKNPNAEQFERYKTRLGDKAPQSLDKFERVKYGSEAEWKNLQTEYRFAGVIDRMTAQYPDLRVFTSPEEVSPEYSGAVLRLSKARRDGLYHYSHYEEGVKINKYLGGVPGVTLSDTELEHMDNAVAGLQNCSLPYDTLLWRGADSRFLEGFIALPKRISDWKDRPLSYKGFASTSIIKDASYIGYSNKDVQLLLIKRGGQPGAAYIEQVSYNRANGKPSEYEVLLQNGAEYRIIEAQKFKGKYIIVAEVL